MLLCPARAAAVASHAHPPATQRQQSARGIGRWSNGVRLRHTGTAAAHPLSLVRRRTYVDRKGTPRQAHTAAAQASGTGDGGSKSELRGASEGQAKRTERSARPAARAAARAATHRSKKRTRRVARTLKHTRRARKKDPTAHTLHKRKAKPKGKRNVPQPSHIIISPHYSGGPR